MGDGVTVTGPVPKDVDVVDVTVAVVVVVLEVYVGGLLCAFVFLE